MSKKKEKNFVVKRTFVGTEKLEDVLLELVNRKIDKYISSTYDETMASATLEGVASK
ncbi:hypothetical protein [Bacillus rubiinfantis]|uniref:hypothetical protein n=1 Tax=Bacillus rubiinfantis TaxID=1499680 RepID=UPI000AF8EBF6|nr:hypothetical protein [Bacillus rubiinfantis]